MSIISDRARAAALALTSYGNTLKTKKDNLVPASLVGQPNGVVPLVNGTIPTNEIDSSMFTPITGVDGDSGSTNYDIQLFVNGKPNPGEVLAQFIATRKLVLPYQLATSMATAQNAASSGCIIDIYVGALFAGYIIFAVDNTTGTFFFPQKLLINEGTLVKLVVRGTVQDASLANLTIGLRADAVSKLPLVTQSFKLIVSGYSAQLAGYPRSDLSYLGRSAGPAVTSYDVITLNPGDGTFKDRMSFNVYGDVNAADAMATYISSIPTGTPFVIYSADEPQTNHLSTNLLKAMISKGASLNVFGSSMVHRGAYAMLCWNDGRIGCLEYYAGVANDDPKSAFTLYWDWLSYRLLDSSSYGVIDNSAANLNLGASDFTLEGWFTPDQTSINNTYTPVAGQTNQTGQQSWLFGLSNGVPAFWYGPVSVSKWLVSSIGKLPAGYRYHWAVTRHGTLFTLWINGVSVATGNSSLSAATTDTTNMTIGDYYKSTGVIGAMGVTRYTGAFDALKVTKACRYNTTFTPAKSLPSKDRDPYWSDVIVHVDASIVSGSQELTGKTLTWVGSTQRYSFYNFVCNAV